MAYLVSRSWGQALDPLQRSSSRNTLNYAVTYTCAPGHLARTDTIITHRLRYKSLPLSFLAFRAIILNLECELTALRYEEYLKPPNDLKKKETT